MTRPLKGEGGVVQTEMRGTVGGDGIGSEDRIVVKEDRLVDGNGPRGRGEETTYDSKWKLHG